MLLNLFSVLFLLKISLSLNFQQKNLVQKGGGDRLYRLPHGYAHGEKERGRKREGEGKEERKEERRAKGKEERKEERRAEGKEERRG